MSKQESTPSSSVDVWEVLRKLTAEAQGFLSMAEVPHHGFTNISVMQHRIDEAKRVLANRESPSTVPAPIDMEYRKLRTRTRRLLQLLLIYDPFKDPYKINQFFKERVKPMVEELTDPKSHLAVSLTGESVSEKTNSKAVLKDADYGPHEVWCDTQNKISESCNCIVGGYIDRLRDLEAQVQLQMEHISEREDQIQLSQERIEAVTAERDEMARDVKDMREGLDLAHKDLWAVVDENKKLKRALMQIHDFTDNEAIKVHARAALKADAASTGDT